MRNNVHRGMERFSSQANCLRVQSAGFNVSVQNLNQLGHQTTFKDIFFLGLHFRLCGCQLCQGKMLTIYLVSHGLEDAIYVFLGNFSEDPGFGQNLRISGRILEGESSPEFHSLLVLAATPKLSPPVDQKMGG